MVTAWRGFGLGLIPGLSQARPFAGCGRTGGSVSTAAAGRRRRSVLPETFQAGLVDLGVLLRVPKIDMAEPFLN